LRILQKAVNGFSVKFNFQAFSFYKFFCATNRFDAAAFFNTFVL